MRAIPGNSSLTRFYLARGHSLCYSRPAMRRRRTKVTWMTLLILLAGILITYFDPQRQLVNAARVEEIGSQQATPGYCTHVADGDTAVLRQGTHSVRVRLGGIDAPEKDQSYGDQSKAELERLIGGKQVYLVETDQDKYGRTVGVLFIRDGHSYRNVNLAMLEAGAAWHYVQYSLGSAYAEAEQRAQAARRGLWAEPSPTAPWDYRHQR